MLQKAFDNLFRVVVIAGLARFIPAVIALRVYL